MRVKVHAWRMSWFTHLTGRLALMPQSSYAFVRYKKKRAELCPSGVNALRTPATNGLVSIILPVFNGADTLHESLASILNQTYQRFEVIAINDGSTDNSADLLEEYARKDARIRVLHQENRKIPRTLSRGARAAQGEFLTWTSCDNRMKPDFLEQLVASLKRHPDWDMVYANMDIIGEEGEPLRNSGWYEGYQQPPRSEHIHLPSDITQLNVEANNYVGGAFMYRSRAAWLLGDYSSIRFTTEDYDYWMRMNSLLTLRHADVDMPLYEYRFHDSSLTARDKELGITSGRPKLMAFDDFRRDFQLSPIIWVIETSEQVTPINEIASELVALATSRGDLIMSAAELASYHLPKLWVSVVFVHVGPKSSISLQPPETLPNHAMRVLVISDNGQLNTEDDPSSTWDMCVAFGSGMSLRRIRDGYAGWFGCDDPSTLLTAIDIRTRSQHEALIEQEIAQCSSQPARRKVSFVICGYKRPEPLLEAVRAAAFQTMSQAEYEVIVVNNDVSDRTLADRIAEARTAWFSEDPESLRYIDNPIKGLSSARNAGIAEAEGEVISFLDDDAIAPATFAEHIWLVIEQHPEIGLLGGHIRLVSPASAPDALCPGLEPFWGHFQTPYDGLTNVKEWPDFPWGSNWSARRLAMLHIGGFRTRYGRLGANFGGGEEIVAAALIQSIGYEIAVSPDSEILHAPESHRFTWGHVRQSVIAGTLSQYIMELDNYIPVSLRLSTAIREVFTPHISPTLREGSCRRRLRAYRRLAYICLIREQWRHRRARREVRSN